MLTHELVHAEQISRAVEKRAHISNINPSNEHRYFGSNNEIEAYAIQAAIELYRDRVPPNSSTRSLRLSSGIYNKYYELFANEDRRRWTRFLKKLGQAYIDIESRIE